MRVIASRFVFALCASVFLGSNSHAATVTTSTCGGLVCVDSISGLVVDGSTYDVTFSSDSWYDLRTDARALVFWGNQSGAHLANIAMAAALNSADAFSVATEASSSRLITVAVSEEFAGGSGDLVLSPGHWLDVSNPVMSNWFWRTQWGLGGTPMDSNVDAIALFTQTSTVPIPAAIWLFGSAVGLLGWMRRKAS